MLRQRRHAPEDQGRGSSGIADAAAGEADLSVSGHWHKSLSRPWPAGFGRVRSGSRICDSLTDVYYVPRAKFPALGPLMTVVRSIVVVLVVCIISSEISAHVPVFAHVVDVQLLRLDDMTPAKYTS